MFCLNSYDFDGGRFSVLFSEFWRSGRQCCIQRAVWSVFGGRGVWSPVERGHRFNCRHLPMVFFRVGGAAFFLLLTSLSPIDRRVCLRPASFLMTIMTLCDWDELGAAEIAINAWQYCCSYCT